MNLVLQNPIFSSEAFTELVQFMFTNLDVNDSLRFLKRTNLVVAQEDKIPSPIPTIKMGATVGRSIVKRAVEGKDEELLNDWRNRMADRLVSGIQQRMNILLCSQECGDENTPSDLKQETSLPWSNKQATPIKDIRAFTRNANSAHGAAFNRITIATSALSDVFNTAEFELAKQQYLALMDEEDQHNFLQDVDILMNLTRMSVEIEDSHYREKGSNGLTKMIRVLPKDKVIFSNSRKDNNSLVADFALGILTEGLHGMGQKYSPIAFVESKKYTDEEIEEEIRMIRNLLRIKNATHAEIDAEEQIIREFNDKVIVWGVVRGNARRHDPIYTGCLTVRGDEDQT